jgi:uncharacterized protein YjcR
MTHIKNALPREERLARLALLGNVGMRLYGKRWHDEMAAHLGVRSRTLRRWLAMQWDIPDEIHAQLRRADEYSYDQKSASSSASS